MNKLCPICGKKYIKHNIGISPSGHKTEYWVHGYKKLSFILGNISFIEEISCSRPIKEG